MQKAASGRLLMAAAAATGMIGSSAAQDTVQHDPVVFVIDGSNSMWGQLDGEAKISLAKSAFSEMLDTVPQEREVGLIAYGHREKSNCADIEVMSVPATGNRDALKDKVGKITPRGKTPITTSLQTAADSLPDGGTGSVVLVSDGIETCKGDPCALAASLKAKNVEFTVHVIGVDLRKEEDKAALACIADRTGGIFTDVTKADELGPALEESANSVGDQEVIQPIRYDLQAIDGIEGPVIADATFDILSAAHETVLASDVTGEYDFFPGDYIIVARADDRVGTLEARILKDDEPETITIVIDAALPEASLEFKSPVAASSVLEINWTGPDGEGDYIELLDADGERLEDTYYVYTADGAPSLMRVSGDAGDYTLRYVYASRNAHLVEMPLVVTPVAARLSAPTEAEVGTKISVEWEGPGGDGDYIGVYLAGDASRAARGYARTEDGNPIDLLLPGQEGDYELRYVTGNDATVLTAVPIRLVPATGAIEAPGEVEAGNILDITPIGSFEATREYITIVPVGAEDGAYTSYAYIDREGPFSFRAPAEAASYEIRIVREASDGNTVLERKALTVTPSQANIVAPAQVSAGTKFQVVPNGPVIRENGDDVYITITRPDEGAGSYSGGYEYVESSGTPLNFTAPEEPGRYEIRYVMVSNVAAVIVSQVLDVN